MHAVEEVLKGEDGQEKEVLQVDFINAFNLANRETTFREVEQHIPEMLTWVLTCYSCTSELMFGDSVIPSTTGFHQGDPLAGTLFSLNSQPVVNKIEEEVPVLDINAWFFDDGTQVGSKEDLKKVVDVILREGPARGLVLSTTETAPPGSSPKSSVWSPGERLQDLDPLGRGVPRIQEGGIVLLGAPVGDQCFKEMILKKGVEKIRETTQHLPFLQDPHTEYCLLRSCLSLPKFMFVLRAVDTTPFQPLLQEFDSITREALNRILAVPVTDLQWAQAKLPVSMGGLGLRAAEDHAPAAHIHSYLASQPLVNHLLGRVPAEGGSQGSVREDREQTEGVVAAEEQGGGASAGLPQTLLTLVSEKLGENITGKAMEEMTQ